MARHPFFAGCVALIASALGAGGVSGQEARGPGIALLVYNHSSLSADALNRAERKVSAIYADAGVDVEWIDPVADSRFRMINVGSHSLGIFVIQIMIRPRLVSKHAPARPVMGTTPEAGETGGTVSLFYDQVVRVARRYNWPAEDLLALAMAHETGHALLPHPAHAAAGIMRAEWDGDDIRRAMTGSLRFTTSEVNLIRAKVEACCVKRAER